VVARDPAHADAWYHLGVCYDKEGDFAKAREAYRRAKENGHGTRGAAGKEA
jgi:Flp pilus assembly protein TadD